MQNLSDQRRYDVDWLRVLAFILLIFYHIGQFYVTDWNWHVKSEYQSDFLKNIMLIVNQWRMPLIFLISGLALSLVEAKYSGQNLLKIRFIRLFIPLLIGMYLIVPPQLFYELIQKEGYNGNYITFFSFYININTEYYPGHQHGPLGLMTWNHLWYLVYLWHYSLVYLVLRPLLLNVNWSRFSQTSSLTRVFFSLIGLFVLYGFWLKPYFPKTNALVNDWYNHALYFTIFAFGYLLAKLPTIWQKIIAKRRLWFTLAVIHYTLLMLLFHDYIGTTLDAWGYDSDRIGEIWFVRILIQWVVYANVVCWLFTVLGFAGAYLTRGNRFLTYMNEAILPWYIMHQTVIIIVAMGLTKFALGGFLEPLLVSILTILICAIGYELIKRNNISRFIFGMKLIRKKSSQIIQPT